MADNGILAEIPGDCISGGATELPAPGPDEQHEPVRKVMLDARHAGTVRITYELRSYRAHKTRNWHWLAVHAERVAVEFRDEDRAKE